MQFFIRTNVFSPYRRIHLEASGGHIWSASAKFRAFFPIFLLSESAPVVDDETMRTTTKDLLSIPHSLKIVRISLNNLEECCT
jgi:hypothetical protein